MDRVCTVWLLWELGGDGGVGRGERRGDGLVRGPCLLRVHVCSSGLTGFISCSLQDSVVGSSRRYTSASVDPFPPEVRYPRQGLR